MLWVIEDRDMHTKLQSQRLWKAHCLLYSEKKNEFTYIIHVKSAIVNCGKAAMSFTKIFSVTLHSVGFRLQHTLFLILDQCFRFLIEA